MTDIEIKTTLTSLQQWFKTIAQPSAKEVYDFLKKKGLPLQKIKYFLSRAQINLDKSDNFDWQKKAGKSNAFTKLPVWAQYGLNKVGVNPSDSSKLR